MKKDEFFQLVDKFRPSHLWIKTGNGWEVKDTQKIKMDTTTKSVKHHYYCRK